MISPIIFGSLFLLRLGDAMMHGTPMDWNRVAYLVKVSTREAHQGNVISCSGSMITQSLVLTASQCLDVPSNETETDGKERKLETFVTVPTHRNQGSMRAHPVYRSDRWMLLRLEQPMKMSQVCPPSKSSTKRITQLPISPSLTKHSEIKINFASLKHANCYVDGFITAPNSDAFAVERKVERVEVNSLVPMTDSELYRANIQSNKTACFEDVGAPLICDVEGLGKFQIGMFYNLGSSAEDRGQLADPREVCVTASEMRFALIINDRELIHKIDDYGVSGLIMAYATCGFM